MRKLIVTFIILAIILSVGFGIYQHLNVKGNVLKEETLFTAKSFITTSIVLGDEIAVGTYDGDIYVIGIDGKIVWHSKIDTNIFNMEKDNSNDLLVCSIYFHLFNNSGESVFTKGYKNYLGVKGRFLNNGDIELLFQSLKDFSYLIVTTDKNGKTISTAKIPDIGESSSISITNNGKILFVGSRGEVYLLDSNGGIEENIQIDNKSGDLHNAYAFYFPNGTIVYGYSFSTAEVVSIPVFFYTNGEKKSITIHSNINRVIFSNNRIVFATQDEFLAFSSTGKLLKRATKYDFTPIGYSSNENSELFLYMRKSEEKNKETIYSISLMGSKREKAKFIFSAKSIPTIHLDTKSDVIFIIEQDTIKILYKK